MTDQTTQSEKSKKLSKKDYEKALADIHIELVKWQHWIKEQGLQVVLIFEGRDAAGTTEDTMNPE